MGVLRQRGARAFDTAFPIASLRLVVSIEPNRRVAMYERGTQPKDPVRSSRIDESPQIV